MLISFLIVATPVLAMDFDDFKRQHDRANSAFDEMEKEFQDSSSSPFEQQRRQPAPPPVTQQPAPEPRVIIIEHRQPPAQQQRARAMPVSITSNQSSNRSRRIETKSAEGYDFTLLGCRREQHAVECKLSIIDDEFDGNLSIYNNYRKPTTMIDNVANTYKSNEVFLKDKHSIQTSITVLTLRNVTTDLLLRFENFSGKALIFIH